MLKYLSLYLSVVASLAFLYTACEREGMPYPYSLTQAEQLLSDRPDRAKTLLDAFRDSLAGAPEETRIYYDLLLVKAEDGCSVRPASDSLIARVIRYYEKRKDRSKRMDAYYYGGRGYAALQDAPRALECFQKAADLSGYTQKYDFLADLYDQESDNDAPASVYLGLGRLFLQAGRPDSAAFYLRKSMEKGDIHTVNNAQKYLFYSEEERSNDKEALAYAMQHILSYDSIRKITSAESARKADALYNYRKTASENQELRLANVRKKLIIMEWLLVCFFLSVGLFFFAYRFRRKKDLLIRMEKSRRKEKEQQYRQNLEYIEENRQKIARLSALLAEAEQQKDTALQDSLETQKELLETTNRHVLTQRKNKEMLEKELTESIIYRKFHVAAKSGSIEIEDEDWRRLQQAVDRAYANFSSRLYALYPKLSLVQLRICCLLKISLSITQIAKLTGRSKSTISIGRTRLYKKLFGAPGTTEELDAFIAVL